MIAAAPSQFRHTTLTAYPNRIAGVTLLDESPGYTGVYLRDENGGLWPARTVSRAPIKHHRNVCAAWLARPGAQDLRGQTT
jgi:hypothetical protein